MNLRTSLLESLNDYQPNYDRYNSPKSTIDELLNKPSSADIEFDENKQASKETHDDKLDKFYEDNKYSSNRIDIVANNKHTNISTKSKIASNQMTPHRVLTDLAKHELYHDSIVRNPNMNSVVAHVLTNNTKNPELLDKIANHPAVKNDDSTMINLMKHPDIKPKTVHTILKNNLSSVPIIHTAVNLLVNKSIKSEIKSTLDNNDYASRWMK